MPSDDSSDDDYIEESPKRLQHKEKHNSGDSTPCSEGDSSNSEYYFSNTDAMPVNEPSNEAVMAIKDDTHLDQDFLNEVMSIYEMANKYSSSF